MNIPKHENSFHSEASKKEKGVPLLDLANIALVPIDQMSLTEVDHHALHMPL